MAGRRLDSLFRRLDTRVMREYRDAGIKSMEFPGYDSLLNQLLFTIGQNIGETTRSYGVGSLHLPFSGELDLSRPDE